MQQQIQQQEEAEEPSAVEEGSLSALNQQLDELMASLPAESKNELFLINELMGRVFFSGPRPIPPETFNEVQLRQELLEYYRTHHRSPGEPLFLPELRHTHAISQQCPREELLRREEVTRSQLFVRVLFNNQDVSQTKKG